MRHAGRPLVLSAALLASLACTEVADPGSKAPPKPAPSAAPASAKAPAAYVYPAPVKGHYKEVNTGDFDLVDGLAYTANRGTVVYASSKAIASPVLASSTCPMTQARAVTLIRQAAYLEVTVDAAGRSDYFAAGKPYGGSSREEAVGRSNWSISGARPAAGRIAGSVKYPRHGGFEFDLPVTKPDVTEVSMGERIHGTRYDATRRAPSQDEVIAAYTAIRRAALAKDLEAMLRLQGFDRSEVEAIRGLPGIEAELAEHADRFMVPGDPVEADSRPGYGQVGGRGKNSKGKEFFNFYEFAPCGEKLVLIGIGENPQ